VRPLGSLRPRLLQLESFCAFRVLPLQFESCWSVRELLRSSRAAFVAGATRHVRPLGTSESVLLKTAIFPGMREGYVNRFNKFAQGWSLHEANVYVSTKGALHDGQDTVKTLRTIIWYKRACIGKQSRKLPRNCKKECQDLNE